MIALASGSCNEKESSAIPTNGNNGNGGNSGQSAGLTLGTPMVSSITESTAVFSCTLTFDENVISNPEEYFAQAHGGFCYCPATQGMPTVNDSVVDATQSALASQGRRMTATASRLLPGVSYTVRAYVTKGDSLYYSTSCSFVTSNSNNGGDNPGGDGRDNDPALIGTSWTWDTSGVDSYYSFHQSIRLIFTTLTTGLYQDTSSYSISLSGYMDTTINETGHNNFIYTFNGTTGTIRESADDDSPMPFTLIDPRHLSATMVSQELDGSSVSHVYIFTRSN